MDDSVNTGTEMARVRQRLQCLEHQFRLTYCAVYGVAEATTPASVDLALATVPQPRVFQWNYRHHIVAEHALFDMDGVLCVDPTDEQNDDGSAYEDFLRNARPLIIPPKTISAIVTSRLEKYRGLTEQWLADHGVRYRELIMLDLPSAEERRRLKAHAPFKAEVYRNRDEVLFVESNFKQAKQIAAQTDKPVMCTENDLLIHGVRHAEQLGREPKERDWSLREADLQARLQRAIVRLREVDPGAAAWLRQHSYNPKTESFSKTNDWHAERAVEAAIAGHGQTIRDWPADPKKRRIMMVAVSFDVRKGAGAAASSVRLREALKSTGAQVATLSPDDFPSNTLHTANQPICGTKASYWTSYHDPAYAKALQARIEAFDPHCIVLGALDRGSMPLLTLASLRYPLVWVVRDNWIHTGGCLFKLPEHEVLEPAAIYNHYVPLLTCDRYKRGCHECPIMRDPREQSKATFSYMLKEQAFSYRTDMVLAPISPWIATMLQNAPLTQRQRIQWVYNPIDLQSVRPLEADKIALRQKYGLPGYGRVVLLAAHTLDNPRKGVALAMKALEGDSRFAGVTFAQMGADPMSHESAAPINVVQLGFISDEREKVEIYNAVDAVLVSALQESLSVVASDAICCGTPVVAFKTSGLSSFLSHRTTGYLARCFDEDDLMDGLNWVLFEADRRQLSLNCRKVAEECFDADRNVARLEGLMQEAVERFAELGPLPESLRVLRDGLGLLNDEQSFSQMHRRHLSKQVKGKPVAPKVPVTSTRPSSAPPPKDRLSPAEVSNSQPVKARDRKAERVVNLFLLCLGRSANDQSIQAKLANDDAANLLILLGSKEFSDKVRPRIERRQPGLKVKDPQAFKRLCKFVNETYSLQCDSSQVTETGLLLAVLQSQREVLRTQAAQLGKPDVESLIQWLRRYPTQEPSAISRPQAQP